MSVDYTASLGVGWIIDKDERDFLIEYGFIEEDDPVRINYYSDYNPEYFLGKEICEVDSGYAQSDVPVVSCLLEQEKLRTEKPNLLQAIGRNPGIHLLCRVC